MKINWKDFAKWSFSWTLFLALVLYFLSGVNMVGVEHFITTDTKKTVFEILWNNSLNFGFYILLFPIGILLLLYELFSIGVSLSLGYHIYGLHKAISLLLPHGLLEFPNILFYSFLAFHMWRLFLKRPRIDTLWEVFWANRSYYMLSYGAVVVAAILEGGL